MPQETDQYLHYTFEGKEPWEEVKFVSRPHWATLISSLIYLFPLWALAGVLLYFFWASWVTGYALLGVLAITVLYGSRQFFLWYNTMAIITDHRVLQIRQKAVFNREIAATMWSNVTSVTVYTPGVLPSLLGFGDMVCDPGGSEQIVSLYAIPDVYRVQQLTLTLMRRAQEEVGSRTTAAERMAKRAESQKVVMD